MTNIPDPDQQTDRQVLATLKKLCEAYDLAAMSVATYVKAVHDSHHWDDLTYVQLGEAMGVSRQAVQQRVARLMGVARPLEITERLW